MAACAVSDKEAGMTRTEIERLAVLESEVAYVKDSVSRIEDKLDAAITCKADKSEVEELRTWGIRLLVGVTSFAVVTLVGLVLAAFRLTVN